MNGSTGCEMSSQLAVEEEPPGPLDLPSSLYATDLTFAGENVFVSRRSNPPDSGLPGATSLPTAADSRPARGEWERRRCIAPGDAKAASPLAFLKRRLAIRERGPSAGHFPDVPDKDWNDWRWQSRHRIRTLDQIEQMLVLSDDEREALVQGESMLPVGITPATT